MSKKTKSIIYNFLSFAAFFLPILLLVQAFTGLTGLWIPVTAFVVSTLIAPKFQAIKTHEGEKLYVKWIFSKEAKEVD
jgi:Na+-driven multidrug efflux pump